MQHKPWRVSDDPSEPGVILVKSAVQGPVV